MAVFERLIHYLPSQDTFTYVRATVHRGGVSFEIYSTDRMNGDPSDIGSRSFAQVLAGNVPPPVPADLLAELQDAVRDRQLDDGPNALDPAGRTCLGKAVMEDDRAEVARLLAAGAEVNALDLHGDSALLLGVRGGRVELIQTLLAAGADASKIDLEHGLGWPGSRTGVIKPLVEAGAPITGSAIAKAVSYKDRACLELFYATRPQIRAALLALIAAVRSSDRTASDRVREAWAMAPKELGQMLRHLEPTLSIGTFKASEAAKLVEQFEALLG